MTALSLVRSPAPPISDALRSISFMQVEGPYRDQHRITLHSWRALNQHIWDAALTVPQGHAYRCEVTVTWEDGRMHEFVFMLEPKHALGFEETQPTVVIEGET